MACLPLCEGLRRAVFGAHEVGVAATAGAAARHQQPRVRSIQIAKQHRWLPLHRHVLDLWESVR